MTHTIWLVSLLAALAMPALAQSPGAGTAAEDGAAEDGAAENSEAGDGDDAPAGPPTASPGTPSGGPPPAAAAHHDFGPAGIMARSNREDLPPLTLASGKPVAARDYVLKSGGYYRIVLQADGSAELALSGGDFWRAVWVNEIVVNDIEIRPTGMHSIEFDNAGQAEVSFVAITPGRFTLSVPGSAGATQQAVFVIQ